VSRALLAALVLAATTLIASGCGGSSKSSDTSTAASTPAQTTASSATGTTTAATNTTPTTPAVHVTVATGTPLTLAAWKAKADAICARTSAQLAANPVKGTTKTFAIVIPQVAADERAEVNELAKLVPPASKKQAWQTMLTDANLWAENTAALGRSAQSGHFTLDVPLIKNTEKIYGAYRHAAKVNGLVRCAENTP